MISHSAWPKIELKRENKRLQNRLPELFVKLEIWIIVPIAFEHILDTMDLEDHHRDPFDIIILAQAKVEKMTIISKDENFPKYAQIMLMG